MNDGVVVPFKTKRPSITIEFSVTNVTNIGALWLTLYHVRIQNMNYIVLGLLCAHCLG